MSSFRQYGGLNRASANNIVRSRYANSDNQTISNVLGLPNSTIVCESNLDLSGNDIYNVSNVILNNGDVITGGSYSGSLVVGGNLEVKQNTNLDGSVDIGGDLTVDGNLEVKQNTNLDGDVEVGGNLNLSDGNANVAGTLEVGGSSLFSQPVNMQSTLDVYDFARFYDNVAIDYGIYVGGNTNMIGDVSMNSTLHVAGQSIFNSDVSLNSMVEVFGQSIFNYDVSMNSTLEVQGATTINGGLTVVGQTSSTSFLSGSDYRIKNNVEPLDDNYTVDELIPVKYVNIILEKEDFGFIAHEVQNVFPNLVTGEKDGESIQTLNYIGLIAILTKEIQELKRRVAVLEKNH
jgi:cytoskeletal protein CcmA (bactofilin family)